MNCQDKLQINTAPGDKAGGRQATAAQPLQPQPQPVPVQPPKESAGLGGSLDGQVPGH
jgi:hypothetical protein